MESHSGESQGPESELLTGFHLATWINTFSLSRISPRTHAKPDTWLSRTAQPRLPQNLLRTLAVIHEIELWHASTGRLESSRTKLISGLAFVAMLSRPLSSRPIGRAMLGPRRRNHTTRLMLLLHIHGGNSVPSMEYELGEHSKSRKETKDNRAWHWKRREQWYV